MPHRHPLTGRRALVTGSTSGIGLGVATAFAAAGADVVMNGLGSPEQIAEAQAQVAAHGHRVDFLPANLRDAAETTAMVDRVIAEGGLDILVNNAGVQHVATIQDFPLEKWEEVIAVNLTACFVTTKAVLPHFYGKNWGRIINIASAHGHVASINKAAYVASKHGLIGLTKVTALEAAATHVTCNAICPGWVLTPLVEKQILALAEQKGLSREEAERELLGAKQPTCRFVTPDQLGALAVFIASDAAAGVTGSSYMMDGGWTSQ